jgi:FG-GAP-like repeat
VGTGDFNGDGQSDILWQNTGGQVSIWEMNNNTLIGGGTVGANPGPVWQAIGTGDFNDDGKSDILWQNSSTGQVSIWDMSGDAIIGGGPVSPGPEIAGPSWKAVGTGDFNKDGHSDILWQNSSTGQVSISDMGGTQGSTVIGGGDVADPGTNCQVIGTGDFNSDGRSDIVLQDGTTGQVTIWEMGGPGGTSISGGGPVGNPGPSWHAVGGNGVGSDILLQNANGLTSLWDVNDHAIVAGGPITNPGPSWRAVGLTHSG